MQLRKAPMQTVQPTSIGLKTGLNDNLKVRFLLNMHCSLKRKNKKKKKEKKKKEKPKPIKIKGKDWKLMTMNI